MSKGKELVKNTLIILIGKFCTQFITFLLIPLYTYFLSTEEYGRVDLIVTYIGLFVPVVTIQLEMAMFRFLIDERNNENEKSKIFTNISITILLLILIFTFIYLLICLNFDFPYKVTLYTCVIATILSNVMLQASRGLGKNVKYSIGCALAGILNITFNLIFVVILKWQGNGVLVSTSLSNILCFVYLFISNKSFNLMNMKTLDKNNIKKYLKYSFPLVPNSIMWWIINASDRTIISIFIGASANGIYAVSHKFSTIIASLYNIFNMSWTESSSLHIKDDDNNLFFSNTLEKVLMLSSALCCCMLSILPLCFRYIVGAEYNNAYIYIPALIIGCFLNIIISFIGGIYVGLRKTGEVAKTSFLSGIINIVINLLLVEKLKIWASAISTIIAFAIMCIYRLIDIQKYVSLKIKLKDIFVISIQFIIVISLYYSKNIYLYVLNVIIAIIISIVINKDIVVYFFKTILKKLKLN